MRLLTDNMKRDYPELCEWSDVLLKEPTKVGDRRQRKRLL